MTKLQKKAMIVLGIILLSVNVSAGVPEDGTIILFKTDQTLNFKVVDFAQNQIRNAIYFKLDVSSVTQSLKADYCDRETCAYSISLKGLKQGVYQIQIFFEGYDEPITKSFIL